ncbi:response regulator transcription factor [Conexibacter sp. SYSU D00693]|uniref:response regulator n=1 Tax=Conexibacter sp. SYSU D00693 TaxID=2812560 RepID=UPI00196BAEF1|nr:response regulator transcription factor [Conexibacter sp. SYSU D00693]
MPKVLIADDVAGVRRTLRAVLDEAAGLDVVGCAADGGEAVERTLRLQPDVVLMDVRMPGVDGIEAIRRLRAAGSRARVLVLTTSDMDDVVQDALEAGALGFLLKDVASDRLADAVHATARGETVMDPVITRRLVDHWLARPAPEPEVRERLAQLTDRELEVLRLLTRGLSNAQIADELVLGEATVKTHVARLLGKLGVDSRLQAVVLAFGAGVGGPPGPRLS